MIKPNYQIKILLKRHRMLLAAVVVSLLLHAAFLSDWMPDFLTQESDQHQILEARLITPPATPPRPAEAPKPRTKKSAKKPATKPDKPAAPAPEKSQQPINAVAPDAEVSQSATVADRATDSPQQSGNGRDGNTGSTDEGIITEADTDNITPYRSAETEFEVRRGRSTSAAGVARIRFVIHDDGSYQIESQTEAIGLASLFFGHLVQKSTGKVTESGLKPDFYLYQYGKDAKNQQTANFDWNEKTLRMHYAKGDSTAPLEAGTQDFLSFMYQFMFTPPLNSMQINMTNGKRLRSYYYSFEGEEVISTKLGDLNTIHLLKSSDSEEKTEIWLATEYRYLPVKIRKTEKDGTVIEQIASKLKVE